MAPLVLLVNRDLPVISTAELVDLMKRQPGSLSYASGGPGTSQHLAALTHIQAGRVRALAVTSAQRNAALPNVPALAELPIAGLAGYEAVGWAGLVGPAAMPAAVVERISRDFAQVLAEPALVQRVEKGGFGGACAPRRALHRIHSRRGRQVGRRGARIGHTARWVND